MVTLHLDIHLGALYLLAKRRKTAMKRTLLALVLMLLLPMSD